MKKLLSILFSLLLLINSSLTYCVVAEDELIDQQQFEELQEVEPIQDGETSQIINTTKDVKSVVVTDGKLIYESFYLRTDHGIDMYGFNGEGELDLDKCNMVVTYSDDSSETVKYGRIATDFYAEEVEMYGIEINNTVTSSRTFYLLDQKVAPAPIKNVTLTINNELNIPMIEQFDIGYKSFLTYFVVDIENLNEDETQMYFRTIGSEEIRHESNIVITYNLQNETDGATKHEYQINVAKDDSKSKIVFDNRLWMHGYFADYPSELGTNGFFVFNNEGEAMKYSIVDTANSYASYGDEKIYFKYSDNLSDNIDKVYVLDGEFDLYSINREDLICNITLTDGNGNYDHISFNGECSFWYKDREAIGIRVYYTEDNDPNHSLSFIISLDNSNNQYLANSFIDIFDKEKIDFACYPASNYETANEFNWVIYDDALNVYIDEEYVKTVGFVNISDYPQTTFEQKYENEREIFSQTSRKVTVGEDEIDVLDLGIKARYWGTFEVIATDGDGNTIKQIHHFGLGCTYDNLLSHTFIDKIENVSNTNAMNAYDMVSNNEFAKVELSVHPNLTRNDVESIFNNLDSEKEYVSTDGDFDVDASIFDISFKSGTTVVSKRYFNAGPIYNDMYCICYTLKNGSYENELVYVYLETGDGGGNIGGKQVTIDGETFNKATYINNGKTYNVYFPASEIGMSGDEVVLSALDYTNYEKTNLIAVFKREWVGESDKEIKFVLDGQRYYIQDRITFTLYDAGDIEVKDGCKFSDFTKIDKTQSMCKYDFNLGEFSNPKEAEDQINEFKRNQIVTYIDENGDRKIITNYVDNYNDFLSYDGDEPCAYYNVQIRGNKYCNTISYKFNRLTTFENFACYTQGENFKGSGKTVYLSEYTGTTSDAQKLMDAVNQLNGWSASTIVIDSDIELDRDVILLHSVIINSPNDDYEDSFLNINLNGHKIDAKGYKIIVTSNSNIRFVNSDTTKPGIITGTGEVLLESAGDLRIKNNIQITNNNGVALRIYTGSNGEIRPGAVITGKTGIELKEIKKFIDYNRWELYTGLYLFGVVVNGVDYAIKMDSPTVSQNNRINLQTSFDENTGTSIKSNNVGIYINGGIEYNAYYTDIIAKAPFVMSGGKLQMSNFCSVESTATYNAANAYSLSNPNGAIFLLDSKDNTPSMKISIQTETNAKYQTNGPLVAEINSESSQLSKFEILSSNQTTGTDSYFDTGAADLFYGGIDKNNISILGGNYLVDVIDKGYVLSGYTYTQNPLTINNKTFNYCLKSGDTYASVNDYDSLKAALENPVVSYVSVNSDINANSGSLINIKYNSRKDINLNEHKIENVKFVVENDEFSQTTSKRLWIYNGELVNANDVVLNVKKASVDVDSVSLSSNTTVIEINNGSLHLNENSIVNGDTIGIDVNVDTAVSDHYVNLGINGTVEAINGPAIKVTKTGGSNTSIDAIDISGWNTKAIVKSQRENPPEDSPATNVNSAIYVEDSIGIHVNNGEVIGEYYGVYFDDEKFASKQENSAFLYAHNNGTIIEGNKAAAHICKNTGFDGYAGQISGGENCIECFSNSNVQIRGGKYRVTDVNGSIIELLDESYSTQYNRTIEGGMFSKPLSDKEMGNITREGYRYVCMQTSPIENEYPYEIVAKYNDATVYQSVTIGNARKVMIDSGKLAQAISDAELKALGQNRDEVNIILSVKTEVSEDSVKAFPENSNCKEFYDIYVDKNYGTEVTRLDEVAEYQLVSISVAGDDETAISYTNPENIVVYHKHGSTVTTLKKVSPEDGLRQLEECYYLTTVEGITYLNIVTRRFSTFGFADAETKVNEKYLKTNVTLTLDYNDVYTDAVIEPSVATHSNGTVSIDDCNVIYEGTGSTSYYSREIPNEVGTYKAVWTIKETHESLSGSGEKEFTIVNNSDECGKDLEWSYDETNKVLTITGTGAMYDFDSSSSTPWADVLDEIETIKFSGKISHIGKNAFANSSSLTKVVFDDDAPTIGENAFEGDEIVINYPSNNKTWTEDYISSLPSNIEPSALYTVTLMYNHGNAGIYDSFTYEYDSTKSISLGTPVRKDYTFVGWYTENGEDDHWGDKIDSILCSAKTNYVLYAKWQKNETPPTPPTPVDPPKPIYVAPKTGI